MASTYSLFPVPAYKVSKAALNMLTVQYAQSFADQGFSFFALSPGVSILSVAITLILTKLIVGANRSRQCSGRFDCRPKR